MDDELQLQVNNVPIGTGTAYKIGENFGIKISFVGDLHSRIKALGGPLQSQDLEAGEEEVDAESLADQFLAGQV